MYTSNSTSCEYSSYNGKYRLNHNYMYHYTSYIPLPVIDVVTVVVGVVTDGQGRLSAVTVP